MLIIRPYQSQFERPLMSREPPNKHTIWLNGSSLDRLSLGSRGNVIQFELRHSTGVIYCSDSARLN